MKNEIAVFFGNGINADKQNDKKKNRNSWEALVKGLHQKYGDKSLDFSEIKNEPFPLVYEAISNYAYQRVDEYKIRQDVAINIIELPENNLHKLLLKIPCTHYITTNYELILENIGGTAIYSPLIEETRYSVFRKHESKGKFFWHVHGDVAHPNSINLGFEHYSGQLQQIRNYTVSGTSYKSFDDETKKPFITRYKESLKNNGKPPETLSWIDLYFTHDIHIMGSRFDYSEIDLWWLLTYRAKQFHQKKLNKRNEIYFYLNKKYELVSKFKIELMKSLEVFPVIIDIDNDEEYYKEVIKMINNLE